jgi:hypothetical protein
MLNRFRTGERAPMSGVYRLIGHDEVERGERLIPLSKGDRFPPCRGCHEKAEWKLEKAS